MIGEYNFTVKATLPNQINEIYNITVAYVNPCPDIVITAPTDPYTLNFYMPPFTDSFTLP